jgi:tetratricopeptide (TPR) repeat protein
MQHTESDAGQTSVLVFGLLSGLLSGLLGGFARGWGAIVLHYILRLALWRTGVIPLYYVHFLCQCHDAMLLQRDGGTFRFRHPLLQDYFANLYSGPDTLRTAASLHNLAELYYDQGDYESARPLHERALQIRVRVLGNKHADTAASLTNLARLLETQGDYDVARPLYERALYIRKKALRKRHPDIATSLINLARLLEAQNADKAARRLYQQVLTIHKESLGSKHADIVYSRERLAAINAEMRKRGHPWWKFW